MSVTPSRKINLFFVESAFFEVEAVFVFVYIVVLIVGLYREMLRHQPVALHCEERTRGGHLNSVFKNFKLLYLVFEYREISRVLRNRRASLVEEFQPYYIRVIVYGELTLVRHKRAAVFLADRRVFEYQEAVVARNVDFEAVNKNSLLVQIEPEISVQHAVDVSRVITDRGGLIRALGARYIHSVIFAV